MAVTEHQDDFAGWGSHAGGWTNGFAVWGGSSCDRADIVIKALDDLDTDDDTRLPDGFLLVDVLALAIVLAAS